VAADTYTPAPETQETQTPPQTQPETPPEAQPPQPQKPKKKKMNPRKRKRILMAIFIPLSILLLGGGTFFAVRQLWFTPPTMYPLTGFAYRGDLTSSVQGRGESKALESAEIAPTQTGTVLESYVQAEDVVAKGDPLFLMDSAAVDEAIEKLEAEIVNLEREIEKTNERIAEYNEAVEEERAGTVLTAPFTGKLTKVVDHKLGDAASGELGTLADDSRMRLTLYFSYAYENDVKEGQSADVSIPQTMSVLKGTVESVAKIRRVTPQGTVLFEARFLIDNPGALAAGMDATATLTGAGGLSVTPFEAGKLENYEEQALFLKTAGRLTTYNMNLYHEYRQGDTLAAVEYTPSGSVDSDLESIRNWETQIADKREAMETERAKYDDLLVKSPIDGTVRYNNVVVGGAVAPGTAVVRVSNTSTMIVQIMIDERDVNMLVPGTMINLEQYTNEGPRLFMGILESVSTQGVSEYNATFYPGTIKVDNFDGSLLEGMYINYTCDASGVTGVVISPVEAVKNTAVGNLIFVKAETPPEGALPLETLPPEVLADAPEGFYPMPVQVGVGTVEGVEIVSGLEEGAEVWLRNVDYDPNAGMEEGMEGMEGGAMIQGGGAIRVG
jgi:multidrug efflux pump subunit AcrA (membrane-fusion protein)